MSVQLTTESRKRMVRVDIKLHAVLTSSLLDVSSQFHDPASLSQGKIDGAERIGVWVDSRDMVARGRTLLSNP